MKEGIKEGMKEDWGAVKEDLNLLLKSFEKITAETGEKIVKQAEDKFADISKRYHKEADPVIKSAVEKGKALNEFVKDKPWQSVGIAAAAGLIVGLLLRNRR